MASPEEIAAAGPLSSEDYATPLTKEASPTCSAVWGIPATSPPKLSAPATIPESSFSSDPPLHRACLAQHKPTAPSNLLEGVSQATACTLGQLSRVRDPVIPAGRRCSLSTRARCAPSCKQRFCFARPIRGPDLPAGRRCAPRTGTARARRSPARYKHHGPALA